MLLVIEYLATWICEDGLLFFFPDNYPTWVFTIVEIAINLFYHTSAIPSQIDIFVNRFWFTLSSKII